MTQEWCLYFFRPDYRSRSPRSNLWWLFSTVVMTQYLTQFYRYCYIDAVWCKVKGHCHKGHTSVNGFDILMFTTLSLDQIFLDQNFLPRGPSWQGQFSSYTLLSRLFWVLYWFHHSHLPVCLSICPSVCKQCHFRVIVQWLFHLLIKFFIYRYIPLLIFGSIDQRSRSQL